MTRLCLFGCKATTRWLHAHLPPVAAVVTIPPALARDVADYDDLSDLPGAWHAARYSLAGDEGWFEGQGFDVGLVMGWQRLIPAAVLQAFRCGVYGMHGSARGLPYGRGRSPMNWALIEGRESFETNLFRYLPGVDDGPVVATTRFSIQPGDTAETMHFKNLLAMAAMVRSALPGIADGMLEARPQPEGEPTYYPKREPGDGAIDWAANVRDVDRLVRAVARPFAGAFAFLRGERLTIWRAGILYTDLEAHPFRGAAPGEVVAVLPGGKVAIRCAGGVLLAHEWEGPELGEGDRLDAADVRRFPRNALGGFDV